MEQQLLAYPPTWQLQAGTSQFGIANHIISHHTLRCHFKRCDMMPPRDAIAIARALVRMVDLRRSAPSG